jgi:8-oxo-dGTP diphosphatase
MVTIALDLRNFFSFGCPLLMSLRYRDLMTDHVRLLLVAAAVLLDGDGRVLLAQRPQGKSLAGLWEFPGGKIEAGERPEDALVRELSEELGIEVAISDLIPTGFASHCYEGFHLLMPLWRTRVWRGEVNSREGQSLAWVHIEALSDYPMPPADVDLVGALIAMNREGLLS